MLNIQDLGLRGEKRLGEGGLLWDTGVRGLIKLRRAGAPHAPSHPFPSQIPALRPTSKARGQSRSINQRCRFDSVLLRLFPWPPVARTHACTHTPQRSPPRDASLRPRPRKRATAAFLPHASFHSACRH